MTLVKSPAYLFVNAGLARPDRLPAGMAQCKSSIEEKLASAVYFIAAARKIRR